VNGSRPQGSRAATIRVLYVIDDLGAAGAERSLAAMAPHYGDRGIRLDVAYLRETHGVGVRPDLETAGARLFSLVGSGGRVGWARRAHRLIAAERPDLVHTTLFESDLAGRAGAAAIEAEVGHRASRCPPLPGAKDINELAQRPDGQRLFESLASRAHDALAA
jgi:hypothetical protein